MIWLILASLLTRILTLIEYRGISFVRPNLAVCVAIGLKIVDTKGTIYVKMICILTLRWNIQMSANTYTLRFNPNSNRHILIKLNKSQDINDENDKLSNIQNESLNHYWTEINAL